MFSFISAFAHNHQFNHKFYASGRADDAEAKKVMILMIMMPRVMITMMQLLMGQWMTCDKLSSGNGGCLIVNQAHTDAIDGAGLCHTT